MADEPIAHHDGQPKAKPVVTAIAPHRLAVLRGLLTLTIACGIFFLLVNTWAGNYSVAAVEAGMSVYAGILLVTTAAERHLRLWTYAYLVPFSAAMMYACWNSSTSITVFTWPLMIPVIAYLLLGRREGIVFTVIVFGVAVAIFVRKTDFGSPYETLAIANVALCALCIFALSHVYERIRESAERELRSFALKDPLTGLGNRAQLKESFQRARDYSDRYDMPLSVALTDLDYFKTVNDELGHEAGDAVLQQVSERLDRNLRNHDQACRVGGEEFVLLLNNASLEAAENVAERVRADIEGSPCVYSSRDIDTSVTIGVAEYGKDGERLEDLLRAADKRLYRGKLRGRNCVVSA